MTGCETWTCPNCNRPVATPYCATCGEQRLDMRDLTVRGLFGQLFHAFSNIDSRLVRSFRRLVNRPGFLTLAYVNGRRIPYIGPIQLFLVANLLFFAAQSATEVKIFSTPLDSHLHHQDWSTSAQWLVARRLQSLDMTLERYAPLFDQAVALNAKSLVILMVLPFALLLPVVFHGSRRPFAAHAAFALHLYSFLLLLFCVAMAVAAVDVLFGGAGLRSAGLDNALSVFNLAACAVYLYIAIGSVYGTSGFIRLFKAAALAVAVACIVLGYRLALLPITLYTT